MHHYYRFRFIQYIISSSERAFREGITAQFNALKKKTILKANLETRYMEKKKVVSGRIQKCIKRKSIFS